MLFIFLLLAGWSAGTYSSTLASRAAAPQMQLAGHVVISQVYGGGGNNGAPYQNDYIELFNPTGAPVSLTGWSVQYASAAGSFNVAANLSGSLASDRYYLVKLGSGGASGGALPAPVDATGTTNMSATAGKVRLMDNKNNAVDLVGYGTTANLYEGGGPAPAPSNTKSDLRGGNGCYDTDDNSADFTTGVPNPRNTSSFTTCVLPTLTLTTTPTFTSTPASTVTSTPTSTATGTNTPTATSTPTLTSTASTAPGGCSTTYSHHSLFINEVAWMGTAASSSDEWIELYNPGSQCVDLSGWTLRIVDANINIHLSGTIGTGSAAYFVLANDTGALKKSNGSAFAFGQTTTSLSLLNSGEALYLIGPDGFTQVDTADWWDGSWPAGIAASTNGNLAYSTMERYRLPNGTIPDDNPTAWVTFAGSTASTPLDQKGGHIHGTPGMANWAWTVIETPSPFPTATRKPTLTFAPTPLPAVVINEILPRPGSDWNGDGLVNNADEFIEIENLGPGIATLTNWKLTVLPARGTGSFTLPTLKLNPNQRTVLVGSATHLLLADSGGTVHLTNSRGGVEDVFTYPAALQADDSWCRLRDGIGNWQDGCFPTPGLENALSGILPALPPPQSGQEAACSLPDIAPDEIRLAECNGSGADIWNQQYWNDLSGQNRYRVPGPNRKAETYIQ